MRRTFRFQEINRFVAINRVLVRHGLGNLLDLLHKKADEKSGTGFPSPQRMRRVLEDLGPSFIKLGQLLSTRADMLPPHAIEELKRLQDRVPPVPFPEIQKVIEHQIGRPLSRIFKEFSPEPMAAASVAQVHPATLFGGQEVVVKIIRPGIEKTIGRDIGLMYALAGIIQKHSRAGRILRPATLIQEFERVIFKELDMFIEAGSMEKFAKNFSGSQEIHIPKVYWEYATRSVLVMERIHGIKMDQVDSLRAHNIDPKEIALIGLRSFSRQLMEFGFFHGDPHPGNTIVMFDGRVALVDFGITGYLDDEMMRHIANIFLGYAEHDYDRVLDALFHAGMINEDLLRLREFQADLKDTSEAFYGRSLATISVRDVYDQVMRIALKYRIRLPRNLLLLLKTFVQTEALGKILHSDASLLDTARPYAQELVKRGHDAQKVFKNLDKDARLISGHLKRLPELLHGILDQTARGRQRLELWHGGFKDLDNQIEKAVNRLTVGMIICASIIAGALILNSSARIFELTIDFLGVQNLSITAILGVTGYVIATLLGCWLIVSILRSRKL
jgi:ubiquinone biosynthesis protein